MEGLSPSESIDSGNDIFSNNVLQLTAASEITNSGSNNYVLRVSRKQSMNATRKTHKFRFWLNKQDQLFSSYQDTGETDKTISSQVSLYELEFSGVFSNTATDTVEESVFCTRIYDFDEPDLIVENTKEDYCSPQERPLSGKTELKDDKYYLESLQDLLIRGKRTCDVVGVPVDRDLQKIAGSTLEGYPENCINIDSSWEAYAGRCNNQAPLPKWKCRLRTLLNFLKNKLPGKRIVSEMGLLKTILQSVLIDHKNASFYCHQS